MLNLMGVLNATAANVSCTCNCKRYTSLQSMEITQLEFVQILVIVVVMMVMVVVITCLLNHYRLSARSLLSRHAPTRRRHLPLANVSQTSYLYQSRNLSHQVYNTNPPERGGSSSYIQREPHRFQPTYPYLPQSLIDLPPTISLSDGEEPPPYQGPCTLQLRDPEQQMELNRESVRAPPNRTVFDSHPLDPSNSCLQARHQKQGSRVEGAPPTYSEVIGHYYHPTSVTSSHNNRTVTSSQAPPSSLIQGLLRPPHQQQGSVDNRNTRNTKEKSQKPQQV
uniref:Prostate transmembrane protein, androgen induced 1 n=1 Tax=Amphilophus citrinellus TaxID=61819 RepID=A0A3Q0TH93_AMPCI